MTVFFGIPISEMGLSPLNLILIGIFGILFLITFVISSKNLDSKGIMKWMMLKPKDWVGYRDNNLD